MTAPGRLRVRRLVVGLLVVLTVTLAVVALTASEERLPETLWVRVLPFPEDDDWDDMRLAPDGERYRGWHRSMRLDDGQFVARDPPLLRRAVKALGFPVREPVDVGRCYEPTGVEREAGGATWAEYRWNGR